MDGASAIVACGSAPGQAMRAIVRVSGAPCGAVVRAVSDVTLQRGVQMTRLRTDYGPLACIALVAPAPHSYTGEDTVEFVCAGNADVVAAIESALFTAAERLGLACRPASPGEYSLRAFVRGRIDLTQAEGIAATIAATNDAHLRAARQLADGGLSRWVRALADCVADDLALVEAGIDFTDQEDVVAIEPALLQAHLGSAAERLRELLERTVPWERLEAVPRVALAGAPNAGKSTLFNALVGRRRAVESAVAGTTRDVLEETIEVESTSGLHRVRLLDMAGIEKTDLNAGDMTAQMEGQARAAIDRAEIVLRCTPSDERANSEGDELLVRTKCDLVEPKIGLAVSARTGAGLDALRRAIAERLEARIAAPEGEALVIAARHETALRTALARLEEAHALVTAGALREPELVAATLRAALDALGSISGTIAADDVLGRIFGKFCVGK